MGDTKIQEDTEEEGIREGLVGKGCGGGSPGKEGGITSWLGMGDDARPMDGKIGKTHDFS